MVCYFLCSLWFLIPSCILNFGKSKKAAHIVTLLPKVRCNTDKTYVVSIDVITGKDVDKVIQKRSNDGFETHECLLNTGKSPELKLEPGKSKICFEVKGALQHKVENKGENVLSFSGETDHRLAVLERNPVDETGTAYIVFTLQSPQEDTFLHKVCIGNLHVPKQESDGIAEHIVSDRGTANDSQNLEATPLQPRSRLDLQGPTPVPPSLQYQPQEHKQIAQQPQYQCQPFQNPQYQIQVHTGTLSNPLYQNLEHTLTPPHPQLQIQRTPQNSQYQNQTLTGITQNPQFQNQAPTRIPQSPQFRHQQLSRKTSGQKQENREPGTGTCSSDSAEDVEIQHGQAGGMHQSPSRASLLDKSPRGRLLSQASLMVLADALTPNDANKLAPILEVPEAKSTQIRANHPRNAVQQCYEILLCWFNYDMKLGVEQMYDKLMNGLSQIGRNDIVIRMNDVAQENRTLTQDDLRY